MGRVTWCDRLQLLCEETVAMLTPVMTTGLFRIVPQLRGDGKAEEERDSQETEFCFSV